MVYIVGLGAVFPETKHDHVLPHSSALTTAAHPHPWDFQVQSETVHWEQDEEALVVLA